MLGCHLIAIVRQLLMLVLTITSIMFLSAGLFHMVEQTMYEQLMGEPREDSGLSPLTLGNAIYYIVVTIATVGYGDISPATDPGSTPFPTCLLLK